LSENITSLCFIKYAHIEKYFKWIYAPYTRS